MSLSRELFNKRDKTFVFMFGENKYGWTKCKCEYDFDLLSDKEIQALSTFFYYLRQRRGLIK